MNITFQKANPTHKDIILGWINAPHVQEFWDNSPEHKEDIAIFTEGRLRPTPYHNGMFDYWVGLIEGTPYCLIMTHEESDATDPPDYFIPYLSKTGKTFSLDFCIGNKDCLGKGLATPLRLIHSKPKKSAFSVIMRTKPATKSLKN